MTAHDALIEAISYMYAGPRIDIERGVRRKFTEDEMKETEGYNRGLYKEYLVLAGGLLL